MKIKLLIGQSFLAITLASSAVAAGNIQAPDRIKSAKKLVFCTEMAFPPWEMLDPTTQKPVGFDIDIAAEVAKKMGVTKEHKNISFDGLIPALQASQCDAIISALYDKPERREVVDFVDYAKTGAAIIVRDSSTLAVSKLDDLAGSKVAVGIGTTGEGLLAKANEGLKSAGKPPINIIVLQTSTEAFQQVATGLVDAYISTPDQAAYYNSRTPNAVKQMGETFNKLATGIAVRKDDKELLAAVDAAVKEMRADGTYKAILDKWSFQSLAFP